jgi:molybdate transport system substrate-binding protein
VIGDAPCAHCLALNGGSRCDRDLDARKPKRLRAFESLPAPWPRPYSFARASPHWRTAMLKATRSFSRRTILAACGLLSLASFAPAPAAAADLTVFAAASLKNALDDVNAAFTKKTNTKVVASYAASGALIKQIEQGAPADVFISADLDWMNYGEKAKAIATDTRVNLLGNRLVMVAEAGSALSNITIDSKLDLDAVTKGGRIAIGDVKSVPAGQYAQQAFQKLGLWAKVEPKIAMSESVRAALALVARGEAPVGVVYETDAKVEPKVKVVGAFPADSHPPIIYPVAQTTHGAANADAKAYLTFLRSDDVKTIFTKYGFSMIATGS